MAEWLKALAWKACILLKVSRVRIPFSPPIYEQMLKLGRKIKNFNLIKDDKGVKLNLKTLKNKLLLKKGFNLLLCKN